MPPEELQDWYRKQKREVLWVPNSHRMSEGYGDGDKGGGASQKSQELGCQLDRQQEWSQAE